MWKHALTVPVTIGISFEFFVLASLWLLLTPYKIIVKIIVRLFRPDLSGLMDEGYSNIFAKLNPTKANIVTTTSFQGQVPIERIQEAFQDRLIKLERTGSFPYEKLRQTWTRFGGYTFWKRCSNFYIENHVRVYDYKDGDLKIPQPCGQADLERVTEKLLMLPWKEGQSPWEYLIVYGLKTDDSETLSMAHIFRRHHALMDGFSRVHMFRNLCGDEGDIPLNSKPSACTSMHQNLGIFKALYDLGKLVLEYANIFGAWRLPTLSNDCSLVCTDRIPVSLVKEIKNKHGVSYACVLYSVVGAALQIMLKNAGKGMVKDCGLFVVLPKASHPGGMVNHLHTNYLRLPIASKSPLQRLHKIHCRLQKASGQSSAPLAIEWLFSMLARLPYIPVFWYGRFYPWFNITMSNFPVQDSPSQFEGCQILDQFGCMGTMVRPFGCAVVVSGVRGSQRICLVMDKSALPYENALDDIKPFIHHELNRLLSEDPIALETIV